MANYKELNRELVEQNQNMRVALQEHREEIISLRSKCMHQHETNVFLRKKCKDLALQHCQQYMEFLDPESPVLTVLREQIRLQGVPTTSDQRREADTQNSSVHQSARLTLENRRSSTFTQTRRSFNSISPIRTSSCAEVEMDDGADETEVEAIPTLLSNAIAEEDEAEDEEHMEPLVKAVNTSDLSNCSMDLTNTLCQEAAESTCNLRPTMVVNAEEKVLRNITNQICEKNTFCKNKPTARNAKKACLASNSVLQESDFLVDRRRNNVTISRGNGRVDTRDRENDYQSKHNNVQSVLATTELEDNTMQDICLEESIQVAREMTRNNTGIIEPFKLPSENESTSSHSIAMAELTLSEFKNATSSTPKQLHSTSLPTTSDKHSSRPKRNCKPMSLTEPSAKSKLRNNSKEKSLSKCKKDYKKSR